MSLISYPFGTLSFQNHYIRRKCPHNLNFSSANVRNNGFVGQIPDFFLKSSSMMHQLFLKNFCSTPASCGMKMSEKDLFVSENAWEALERIFKSNGGKYLRIRIGGGGCAGLKYEYSLDYPNEDDKYLKREDAGVIVDKISLSWMKGSSIDYLDDGFQTSFKVLKNPLVGNGMCSCGNSFSSSSIPEINHKPAPPPPSSSEC